MYQIMCDDYILHDAVIDDLKVIGARCGLEVNKTGSLTFQIAPTHPYYDKIKKHTSEIKLYQDDRVLFCGRVLNDEITFDNIKNVECEGELAYLLDSIQRAKEYHLEGGSSNVIETYLKDIVAIHNSQVDDSKKFSVGLVNITDPNNYLYKISNYEDTLTTLTDKLLNVYGGYLVVRHSNDVRYLDYVDELTNVCNQTIEFGKNIIDMTRYIKGEDVYTALIPLGATNETNTDGTTNTEETYEKRLTISSLPDSTDGTINKVNDYVYDSEGVEQWGWIWKVEKWDDVTVAENLLRKAKDELRNSIDATLTLDMTAIDLHLLDVDIDRINVGDRIQCISLPHNLNTILIVKSIEIDIDSPENTKIKLVSPTGKMKADNTITSGNKDNEKNIIQVKDELNEGYPTYEDVDNKLTDFGTNIDNKLTDFGTDVDNKFTDFETNLKDWANDTFLPMGADGAVDLSGYAKKEDLVDYAKTVDLSDYAKIDDVNTAFNELATALEGV